MNYAVRKRESGILYAYPSSWFIENFVGNCILPYIVRFTDGNIILYSATFSVLGLPGVMFGYYIVRLLPVIEKRPKLAETGFFITSVLGMIEGMIVIQKGWISRFSEYVFDAVCTESLECPV